MLDDVIKQCDTAALEASSAISLSSSSSAAAAAAAVLRLRQTPRYCALSAFISLIASDFISSEF